MEKTYFSDKVDESFEVGRPVVSLSSSMLSGLAELKRSTAAGQARGPEADMSKIPSMKSSQLHLNKSLRNSPVRLPTGVAISQPFDPKEYACPGASAQDIELYKEVFDMFDMHDKGVLAPMDLRNALMSCGYRARKHVVYQFVAELDSDESGGIDFREFVRMMTERPCDKDTDEDILRIYHLYDQERKGYITRTDIQNIGRELDDPIPEKDIEEIISKCDPNGDGVIRQEAFLEFMRSKNWGD
eukprot:TRINITY_DN181_c0_g2_i1.p1 TRINITY_DN181_c0_g2~~TRINITY_DN181_c0_g2_i1.p1  ORF type:complete len:243 (-),score=29.73 TRINITY_DN181_c0_g2_i1:21-749(-)